MACQADKEWVIQPLYRYCGVTPITSVTVDVAGKTSTSVTPQLFQNWSEHPDWQFRVGVLAKTSGRDYRWVWSRTHARLDF